MKKRRRKKRQKLRKRDIYLIIAIINVVWYAVAVLVLSYLERTVPDTLTDAWFKVWGLEFALIFGIKVTSKEDDS